MAKRPTFIRPGTPLTPSTFYILLSLNSHERDADGIATDVAMSSAGRVEIGAARLAMRLRHLTDAGLVSRHNDRYRLAHGGRLLLADELERVERAVRPARSRRSGT